MYSYVDVCRKRIGIDRSHWNGRGPQRLVSVPAGGGCPDRRVGEESLRTQVRSRS